MTTAPKRTPCVWQHPFVDVFKTFSVEAAERRGDVSEEIDKEIGKRVFRIHGHISAKSFLLLPGPATSLRTLGLTGQYLYLQVKALGTKVFLAHFDFAVQSAHPLRITLSNLYTKVKSSHHSVQWPCDLQAQWSVVCIHVPAVLASCTCLPTHSFTLKGIQLCASVYVRNLYTSDIRYTVASLPRDMMLDNHHGTSGDRFAWIDIPGVDSGCLPPPQPDGDGHLSAMEGPLTLSPAGDRRAGSQTPRQVSPRSPRNTSPRSPRSPRARSGPSAAQEAEKSGLGPLKPSLLTEPLLQVRRVIGVRKRSRRLPGLPEPIPRSFAVPLRSHDRCPTPQGIETPGSGSSAGVGSVLVASSGTLTWIDLATREQRCHFGHTEAVELLEASPDGQWAASVQGASDSGAPPLLRLWRCQEKGLHCCSQLSCPGLTAVRTAAFSPSLLLAVGGLDQKGRQQLLVWDFSRLVRPQGGGCATLLARQTSADWDVDCLRFSPYEEHHLVSCGSESIRFWRIKDGHLPGCNVQLNSLARQSHFTCIAFEPAQQLGASLVVTGETTHRRHFYVGTATGKLLQLSYADRKVQAVFDLHAEAITALCTAEGLVITASADKSVKVWPLDFRSHLHAKHESPVVGVSTTLDGSQVLCSTKDGSVGLLDMRSQAYVDLASAHGARIVDGAVSLFFQELATVSADSALKIWNLSSMCQTHEFRAQDDLPLTVACHPSDRHLVAVGFHSGTLRVFDVDGPALLCEYRHYVKPLIGLLFVSDCARRDASESYLVTCDATGALALRDQASNFQAVRLPDRKPCCTAPPEYCAPLVCAQNRLLQYQDAQSAALLSFPDCELQHKLKVQHGGITALSLSLPRAEFAVLGTANSNLHVFSTSTGSRVATHSLAAGPITAAVLAEPGGSFQDTAVLLAAAQDARLRVWQFCADSRSPGELASAQTGERVNWVARLLREPPFEQSLSGHARAAHRVLASPRWVVSVSSSEVIWWAARGNYFEQLFLDNLLTDLKEERAPRTSTQGGQLVTNQREEERAPMLSPKSPQRQVLADLPDPTVPTKGNPALKESAPPPALQSRTLTDVNEEPASTALVRKTVQPDALPAAGLAEVAPVASAEPIDAIMSMQQMPAPLEVAPAADTAATLVQPPPVQEEGATHPPPAAKQAPPKLDLCPLDMQEARGDDLCLRGVGGCATWVGRQACSWCVTSGLFCQVLGSVVQVVTLPAEDGAKPKAAEDPLAPSQQPAPLVEHQGLEAFALDLDPAGGLQLGLLAVDLATGSSCLSLWCLKTALQRRSAVLPDAYSRPSRTVRASRPLLRLFAGGDGAVTAVGPCAGGRGRVDLWRGDEDRFHLVCSAEPPCPPLDLVLLSHDGAEFLTLSLRTVVFWCCPTGDALLFQVTEQPVPCPISNADDAFEFTSMAIFPLQGWHLLLVATSHGSLWAYNADENLALAELTLLKGQRIQALACASWPTLLCGVGEEVRAFRLCQGDGETLLAEEGACAIAHLDGQVREVWAGRGEEEGVASTAANSVWYFHLGQGKQSLLHSFHTAPTRALCSNEVALRTGGGSSKAVRALATCADDGKLCIWSCDPQTQKFERIKQLTQEGTCTSLTFLSTEIVACAFASGRVRAHALPDLEEQWDVQVGVQDPVLALAAVAQDSLVVCLGSGQLIQVSVAPMASKLIAGSSTLPPEATNAPRFKQLQAPRPTSIACRLERSHDGANARFLVCYASLELWIWDCPSGPGCRPRHACTWVWPESRPKPWPRGRSCSTLAACLDMLASPPLVATFVTAENCNLVAVTAPPAQCIYLYNCSLGAVVNRVTLQAQLPQALCLWAPPQLRAADGARPEQRRSALVFALGRSRFSCLRVSGSGARASWLQEPQQIPGCMDLLAKRQSHHPQAGGKAAPTLRPGAPEVCCLSSGGGRQLLVVRGDTALSCWETA